MNMRGEVCIGSASVLSFASLLLLIFMHVGQINTSAVPRNLAMVKVNTTSYGKGLQAALGGDPVNGLYTSNASAPLGQQAGLRNLYDWGLYSHCAYVNTTHGICSNHSTANRFQPFDVIRADMLQNYSSLTNNLNIPSNTTFIDSSYLGEFSNGAYYLLLLGTICAGFAFLTGLIKHTFGFLTSTVFAMLGSLMLLIGATIWTVIVKKAESINDVFVGPPQAPVLVGIVVSMGDALFLAWAAFALLIVSILPYMISCCTYRG